MVNEVVTVLANQQLSVEQVVGATTSVGGRAQDRVTGCSPTQNFVYK